MSDDISLSGTALRHAIKGAYIAGFMASAEGWNGEYPLEKGREKDVAAVRIAAAEYADKFTDRLRELLA